MAPTQTMLNYFNQRKSQSDSRVTRSQKLSDSISHPDNLTKNDEVLTTPSKTPSKTRSKSKTDTTTSPEKETPSKTSRRNTFKSDSSSNCDRLELLGVDEMDPNEVFISPLATPNKRRTKSIKDPCSPPKLKCPDMSNDLVPSSAATPSTMFKTLTLDSPVDERKSQTALPPKSLFPEPDDLLGKARIALHTHSKTSLPGREGELTKLNEFILNHLQNNTSGSLYISGPPGTGKTACLGKVLEQHKMKQNFKIVNINCTSVESPKAIYSKIASQLNLQPRTKSGKAYLESIEKHFLSNHKTILMVLDEMDQLDTRSRSVLYTIFEWPTVYPSGIILIGIANALDLTDRLLPRLKAKLQLAPQLLHFAPYTRQQLLNIFSTRLEEANASNVFHPAALQLLASKLSAVNGDARRALDTARRTVENESQKYYEAQINSAINQTQAVIQVDAISEKDPVRMSPRKAMVFVPLQHQGNLKQENTTVSCPMKSPLQSPSKFLKPSLKSLKSPLKPSFKSPGKSPLKSALKSPLKSPLKSLSSPLKSLYNSPCKSRLNDSPLKENRSPVKPRSAKKSLFTDVEKMVKPLQSQGIATANEASQLKEPCISISNIMSVVNDVYGSSQGLGKTSEGGEELPLHQKLAICTLLLILREGKSKDVTVGKLHDVYRRVCTKRHMDPLDSGSFLSMLGLIEARGILLLPGRGKRSRLTKVCMQWIEDEVVAALRDRDLLGTILKDKSCLS